MVACDILVENQSFRSFTVNALVCIYSKQAPNVHPFNRNKDKDEKLAKGGCLSLSVIQSGSSAICLLHQRLFFPKKTDLLQCRLTLGLLVASYDILVQR